MVFDTLTGLPAREGKRALTGLSFADTQAIAERLNSSVRALNTAETHSGAHHDREPADARTARLMLALDRAFSLFATGQRVPLKDVIVAVRWMVPDFDYNADECPDLIKEEAARRGIALSL